jgi:hypothetical protein
MEKPPTPPPKDIRRTIEVIRRPVDAPFAQPNNSSDKAAFMTKLGRGQGRMRGKNYSPIESLEDTTMSGIQSLRTRNLTGARNYYHNESRGDPYIPQSASRVRLDTNDI